MRGGIGRRPSNEPPVLANGLVGLAVEHLSDLAEAACNRDPELLTQHLLAVSSDVID
jgi:hypothetical protein